MDQILIIDGDPKFCAQLDIYLRTQNMSLTAIHKGQRALTLVKEENPQLIILDTVLPDTNGFEILHTIRAWSDLPIIILTSRDDEVDKVLGLEMGADDYLIKPFPFRELVARIRAILRRSLISKRSMGFTPGTKQRTLCVGSTRLDTGSRAVTVNNLPIHLTSAEFSILETLMRSAGEIVPREKIAELSLGRMDSEESCLNVHMSNLRKKMGEMSTIKTVRGIGYMYILPEVKQVGTAQKTG
jgi:two-component system response regulator CpxR